MRLINADALKETITNNPLIDFTDDDIFELIDHAPTVEIPTELCKGCRFLKDCETCEEKLRPQGEFSRKDLESWLYQIAMNNIGTDFEKSVVEIIHRLDGFERFVSEQKGGAE